MDPSIGVGREEGDFLCPEEWRGGWLCVQDEEWSPRGGLGEPRRELRGAAALGGSLGIGGPQEVESLGGAQEKILWVMEVRERAEGKGRREGGGRELKA